MVVPLKLCYGNEKQQQVLGSNNNNNNNNIMHVWMDGWMDLVCNRRDDLTLKSAFEFYGLPSNEVRQQARRRPER